MCDGQTHGEHPQFLYKYKAFSKNTADVDMALATLSKRKLWASRPGKFNDPFDCQIRLDYSIYFENLALYIESVVDDDLPLSEINQIKMDCKYGNDKSIIQFIEQYLKSSGKKSLQEKVDEWIDNHSSAAGVISLSEKNDNLLMWAHYADYHQGYCLKLAFNSEFSCIKKVIYGKDYPSLIDLNPSFKKNPLEKWLSDVTSCTDASQNYLFRYKSKDWEYENEWRLIVNIVKGADGKEIPIDARCGLNLAGVIFGARTSEENKQSVIDAINKAGFKNISYEQAIIQNNKFAVKIIPYLK